jgi:nucleoside 2-deoxyribosyltransferase
MSEIKSICLCGSMSVLPRILEIKVTLEAKGFFVETPSLDEPSEYSTLPEENRASIKAEMIRRHLERIKRSDAILVVNESAKGVENYIGANSFLEMGFAFAMEKPILLLNAVPEQPNRDELLGLNPRELRGDLDSI